MNSEPLERSLKHLRSEERCVDIHVATSMQGYQMPRSILIPTAGANQDNIALSECIFISVSGDEMFPGALAHNYDHFPLLNIRLYSHVGALIESAHVISRRMFSCNCRQFFWSEALCAIDCKSQRRSLPQHRPDKRWNETTDAILGQYEIEISQLYSNKVTGVVEP